MTLEHPRSSSFLSPPQVTDTLLSPASVMAAQPLIFSLSTEASGLALQIRESSATSRESVVEALGSRTSAFQSCGCQARLWNLLETAEHLQREPAPRKENIRRTIWSARPSKWSMDDADVSINLGFLSGPSLGGGTAGGFGLTTSCKTRVEKFYFYIE